MTAYRNVFSLILAAALLQVSSGLLGVIVPLGLGDKGVSNSVIGLIAGIYSAGFMLGAMYAPRLIRDIGNIRVFAFAAAIAAVGALIMAMFRDPYVWALMRFLQGIGIALMFASDESWMTEATPEHQRGSVLGIYHVAAKVALVLGPFLAVGYSSHALEPFIWCGIFLTLALIPVCVTRRLQPNPPDPDPYPISRMFKVTPAAVIGVFVAGFSNTGFLALLPVYAEQASSGGAAETAAKLMAAAFIGGVISQFPAGLLSDKIDRRLVIAGMGIISGIAAIALTFLKGGPDQMLTLVLLGLWGAGALSFYGLCVAHAADRCEPDKIARMLSGLLFVWATGSVLGPIIFGFVMSLPTGTQGLFFLEAAIGFLLAFAMIYRRTAKAPVRDEQRESYEAVLPNSLPAVEIDPRTDVTEHDAPQQNA